MKNLKRILLTVIASAISLQAQAGVSEYVAQAKAFACNHKGKIAIGVSAAIIAGVAYYYMRSKKAHARIDVSYAMHTLTTITIPEDDDSGSKDIQGNASTQQSIESQMRIDETQPETEESIILKEGDSGAGADSSDDDNFEPNIFNDNSDVESEQSVQNSTNLGMSQFTHISALGELTDSFILPEAERVDKRQHIAVAVAVDPVRNMLGQISQQINVIKDSLNDKSKIASAVEAIKVIYSSKQYPIEAAVINYVAAQGLDGVIKNIINRPSDRTYTSLIEEYERSVDSLRYVAYQEQ